MPATVNPRSTAERLLTRERLPVVVGVVALVTLGATENRAVGTVLPTLLADLHAVPSFGLVVAAPLASYLVALACAGAWCDRSGPVPALRVGAATFAVAQLMVGTATGLPVVVLGRLLSGLAEGILDVALMVLVARVLDPRWRPKVMALVAMAWVLPSVLGPLVTGLVTSALGWRWAFLGAVLLLVPVWLVLRPALRRPLDPAQAEAAAPAPVRALLPRASLAAAALVALNLVAERFVTHPAGSAVTAVVAVAALGVGGRRLLPGGTFRAACGIGAVVALRGLAIAAFLGVGSFLPLLMVQLRGFGLTAAGVSLSVTGVMWSVGSAVQSRWSDHPMRLLRAGFGALVAGLAGSGLLVWTAVPVWAGLAAWALAGVGIGLTSSTLSVLTMAVSDAHSQGRNNAGAQMASGMSSAVFLAASGGVLAVAGGPDPSVFAAITALGVAVAAVGLLVAHRRASCLGAVAG